MNPKPSPAEFRALPDAKAYSRPLQALWEDARGNWHEAHELAQAAGTPEGSWVHAYLHRKEGDEGNAAYWYRASGRPICQDTLEDEWQQLVSALLAQE